MSLEFWSLLITILPMVLIGTWISIKFGPNYLKLVLTVDFDRLGKEVLL